MCLKYCLRRLAVYFWGRCPPPLDGGQLYRCLILGLARPSCTPEGVCKRFTECVGRCRALRQDFKVLKEFESVFIDVY